MPEGPLQPSVKLPGKVNTMRMSVTPNPSRAAWIVAGVEPPIEIEATRELVYGTPDGHELLLDLYQPVEPVENQGAIVYIHGGGWHAGERAQFGWHCEQTAALGYVSVTIDYRLTGTAPYPACFDDCQRAVRWLRSRADELKFDASRIAAFGSSAGGHLVAMLGTRDTRDDSIEELAGLSSRVQCVVDYHGVHLFRTLPDTLLLQECSADLFRGSYDERSELWDDASPELSVDADAAPTLLIHDPDDPTVPYDQSVQFALKLMQAFRPVSLMPVPGAGHGFGYNPQSGWQQRTWPVALNWLQRFIGPAG